MKLRTIKKLNLRAKKILLRVNFDLPIKKGRILDETRIKAHLPTIFYLMKNGAKTILISHLDDPLKNKKLKTKNKRYQLKIKKQYSLKPIYKKLKFKIKNLKFVDDCLGEKVKKEIEKMKPGEAILLENLRFYKEEEKNDKIFAKKLASLADIYINDAFPVCHRNHASVSAITKYLPSYAGFLLEKEINNLSQILEEPKYPLIVVMGGAKISAKLPVIKNLLKIADKILIGGALANTFFQAKALNINQSAYEEEMISEAKKISKNKKIILPVDIKIKLKTKNKKQKIHIKNIKTDGLRGLNKNFQILDIGQETIKLFSKHVKSAKMIIWNGPMGYFEEKPFDRGTKKLLKKFLKTRRQKFLLAAAKPLLQLKV